MNCKNSKRKKQVFEDGFSSPLRGYIETPYEIHLLMEKYRSQFIGVSFWTWGITSLAAATRLTALRKYSKRIWHIHSKTATIQLFHLRANTNGIILIGEKPVFL